jgi:hypothetical protein
MRRIVPFLLPLVLVAPACKRPDSTSPKPLPPLKVTTTPTPAAPAWIDNPTLAGPFSAVGIEAPNPIGDLAFQRTAATANARTTFARDFETRVRSVFQQLSQTSLAVGEKLRSASGQKAQEDTVRQLTDWTLRGTQARQFWTDPGSGILYVLLVADPALTQDATRAGVRRGLADLGAGQGDLQEAMGRLDTALAAPAKEPR